MSSSIHFTSTISPWNMDNCPANNDTSIKYFVFVKIIIIPCYFLYQIMNKDSRSYCQLSVSSLYQSKV